jgi:Flp pilus assembly CpaF family ATPase
MRPYAALAFSLAAFAPLTHQGAVVNVERNAARALTLQDMAARAALPAPAVHLLTNALNARRNVIVVGPRSSGRRMVLGALLASIPANDRVMIVEDRDELTRSRRDAAALRAEGDWSLAADLATRMRAHRIAFSETNEPVARAFVGALSTGAEGMLLTVEAPSALTGLGRLAALAAHSAGLSRDEAAARLVATRPLIVETARFGDGQCRVTGISELRGSESNMQVSGLFAVRIEGTDASGNLSVHLVPTGASPSFA